MDIFFLSTKYIIVVVGRARLNLQQINESICSSFNLFLLFVIMREARLNTRSQVSEVAGIVKYFLAIRAMVGKRASLSFHQVRIQKSANGVLTSLERYSSNSLGAEFSSVDNILSTWLKKFVVFDLVFEGESGLAPKRSISSESDFQQKSEVSLSDAALQGQECSPLRIFYRM